MRPQTYRTLFGLLASTGLRISEALRLRCDELDPEEKLLVITETKFRKSRLVPLHPTVGAQLESYLRLRHQRVLLAESDTLFVSDQGTALNYWAVCNTFRRLRRQLGWETETGRRQPRLYDLRHTFACRRLLQWYRDGIEIDHAISSLSTYMGHVEVSNTYWYLTGTLELFRTATERFEQLVQTKGKETQS